MKKITCILSGQAEYNFRNKSGTTFQEQFLLHEKIKEWQASLKLGIM
jgi:hypothetical protein